MINFCKMEETDIIFLNKLLNEKKIIAFLHNAVKNYEEWLETYKKYWKSNSDEEHFIIYFDDSPVGWLRINGLSNIETAWIAMLAISPEQQNKGIGHCAVSFSEENVKSRGLIKIGIHTTDDNLIAQKLYEKCGYSIVEYGKCTTGDGVNRMGYTYMKKLI